MYNKTQSILITVTFHFLRVHETILQKAIKTIIIKLSSPKVNINTNVILLQG